MSARRRMLFNGLMVASLAVDQAGNLLGQPKSARPGLLDPDDPEADRVAGSFGTCCAIFPPALRRDDAGLGEAARAALRRALGRRLGKRPMVDVHLIRV